MMLHLYDILNGHISLKDISRDLRNREQNPYKIESGRAKLAPLALHEIYFKTNFVTIDKRPESKWFSTLRSKTNGSRRLKSSLQKSELKFLI